MPSGRPSLYRPDYCAVVKDFNTIAAFARHIGVVVQTVYDWTDKHPEFAEAVKGMTRSFPTRYRPEYCDDVVECLKDGHSLAAFAATIGVAHRSIYAWMAGHPEFDEAVKRAQAKSALWWEQRLLELVQDKRGNAGVIIFGLRNRAREEWDEGKRPQTSDRGEAIHRIERVVVRPGHTEERYGLDAAGGHVRGD